MLTRYFALVVGIIYALIGVLGFIPGLVQPPLPDHPPLALETGFGRLLGIFPINWLHNLVHLGLGVWGIVAFRTFLAARFYSRALAIIYGVLAVMGLIPVLNTTFGLVPIYGSDVWLHALTALIAAYFGWVASEGPVTTREREPRRELG